MRDQILKLHQRIAALERRASGALRYGQVMSVDPAAGTVTVALAEGHESPPVPYAQIGGALSVHAPPSVGQNMMLASPSGDLRQAVAMPYAFGGSNKSPGSSADTNVLTFGDVTVSLAGDGVTIEVGGATIRINGDGVAVEGGDVKADTISLKGHTHTDTPGTGAGTTTPPNP